MLLALVLVSGFLHAGWNALVKRTRDPVWGVHLAVAFSGLLAAGVALVQLALGAPTPSATALGWSLAAGVFESRYFHALGRALVAGPLAPVYTLSRGGAAVLIWPLSVLFLDEPLGWLGAAGTVLVLAGLAAAGGARGMGPSALRLGLACALCIAGYHFGYKLALAAGGAPAAVFALSIGTATLLNLATGGRGFRRDFGQAVARVESLTLLSGAVCAAAFLLFLLALARGGAAHVFTLRNTSVVFATALAPLLGERPGARQVVGALLVCAGAIVLGLAS
ncbi:MAG: permease [Planctomycetes bacterium]|nr:permease [Planctomycetota bacterium]